MTAAMVHALVLELKRDRGALVMTFILPVAFFLVFAFIFASGGGSDIKIRLALADTVKDADTSALAKALREDPGLRISTGEETTAEQVRDIVRRGKADVGLVIRHPLRGEQDAPPLLLLVDPTRSVAASMLAGRLQKRFVQQLPDAALGGVLFELDRRFLDLSDEQRQRLEQGLAALRQGSQAGETPDFFGSLYAQESVIRNRTGNVNSIAYYAGAVAVLFLLFASVHGAISLLDARQDGRLDRILAGPAGMGALINAHMIFLTVLGVLQVAVIFTVAWLLHDVDLPGHLPGWFLITACVAFASAGLALLLVSLCRSKRQAQTVSNVVILILSAIGGSMVPRFIMPPILQKIGWFTPNTWALEAYTREFWRGEPLSALLVPLALLVGAGLVGWWLALVSARRDQVL